MHAVLEVDEVVARRQQLGLDGFSSATRASSRSWTDDSRAWARATPSPVAAICRESAAICARSDAAADRVAVIWL